MSRILSTGGGVHTPLGGHPAPGRPLPPQVDTLLGRHPHPIRRPLQRTARILLECILVFLLHLSPHTTILYIYCPLTKCGKVIFLVVFVCLSIHRGGGCTSPQLPSPTCSNLFNLDLTVQGPFPRACSNLFTM